MDNIFGHGMAPGLPPVGTSLCYWNAPSKESRGGLYSSSKGCIRITDWKQLNAKLWFKILILQSIRSLATVRRHVRLLHHKWVFRDEVPTERVKWLRKRTKIVWTRTNLLRVQGWVRWQLNSWNDTKCWSTIVTEEIQVICWEWHHEWKLNSCQQGIEITSILIPQNCRGCNWNGSWSGSSSRVCQDSSRGFAKILLAWPKLRQEKDGLSYRCPIITLCHVQCKKDTYHLIKNTAIPLLNNSIDQQLKKRIIDSVHQGSKRNLTRLQNGGESLQQSRKSKKWKKRDVRKRSTTAEKMSKALILHNNRKS
jgi:hypothetical protein